MELQDELLPAHKRRVGRIGSLHEFQQRALSYQDGHSPTAPTAPATPDLTTYDTDISGNLAVAASANPPPGATAVDIRDLLRFSRHASSGVSPSCDTDGSEYHLFDQLRKPMLHSQRSRSLGSLFGGARYKPKSSAEFYGRQIKVLSFLVLLGVIGGPLGYGMRRYDCILLQDKSFLYLTETLTYRRWHLSVVCCAGVASSSSACGSCSSTSPTRTWPST